MRVRTLFARIARLGFLARLMDVVIEFAVSFLTARWGIANERMMIPRKIAGALRDDTVIT